VGQSARTIPRIKRLAGATPAGGRSPPDDPIFQGKIARPQIKLRALPMGKYPAHSGARPGPAPRPQSSILKLRGSEILQQIYELAMEIMGLNSLSWFNEPGVVPESEQWVASAFNYLRATTIYGGSNEIQKNIIAKQILGLGS